MIKWKRGERDPGGECLIWSAHTKHNLPFNCNNTTQDQKKTRKAPIDGVKGT